MCGLVDEAGSDCTTQEDSISTHPSSNGTHDIPYFGWKGIDSGVSQVSRYCSSNNGGVVEEVWNRKGSGKLRSSHYKGIIPQPNGRWGAQIYNNHQRVCLGTFNTEEDATAALKFRDRKAITNLLPIGDTNAETIFLGRHSKAEIVDMP